MKRDNNILLIGYGAIGATVSAAIDGYDRARISHVLVKPGREDKARQELNGSAKIVCDLSVFLNSDHGIDVVADCAGHSALASYGSQLLAAGIDIYSLSCGAMAYAEIANELQTSAETGGAQLKLLSGAIGGLDLLSAGAVGGVEQVTYRGRKPPKGWLGSAAEKVVDLTAIKSTRTHFSGTAGDAATLYPKNANVAAGVALSGIGLQRTKVELMVDPDINVNIHEIHASGKFGSMSLRVEGKALENNPRSSALAAFSMIRALMNRYAPISIG